MIFWWTPNKLFKYYVLDSAHKWSHLGCYDKKNTLLFCFHGDFFTFLSHKNVTLTQQCGHASAEQCQSDVTVVPIVDHLWFWRDFLHGKGLGTFRFWQNFWMFLSDLCQPLCSTSWSMPHKAPTSWDQWYRCTYIIFWVQIMSNLCASCSLQ